MHDRHGQHPLALERGAAEQRDAADEGRLDAYGNVFVGNKVIVDQGKVVRPSQLIASVRRTHAPRVRTWEQ
jgi:hypothetical protein